VFTVKTNQPILHAACKNLPWTTVPAHTTTSTGHGRRVTRTIKVVDTPAWVQFTGATQVAQIRCTDRQRGGDWGAGPQTERDGRKPDVVQQSSAPDGRSW